MSNYYHKVVLLFTLALGSAEVFPQTNLQTMIDRGIRHAMKQCLLMSYKMRDSTEQVPRSLTKDGRFQTVTRRAWTSGFFPGTLWYLYEATGNDTLRYYADRFTRNLLPLQGMTTNHDIGFMMNCSFGNAYRITRDTTYRGPLVVAANSLSMRFNDRVGCTRSWGSIDDHRNFLVIIDNMMNLELLENVAKIFHDSRYDRMAQSHADVTMANHFRPDFSCYHVVDYDMATGRPKLKRTAQGYADNSAWARGQAWALYGYTMMYRETGQVRYIKQAEHVAGYLLGRLKDGIIPTWDFDAPATQAEKDASAAAIMASAFLELSRMSKQESLAIQCQQMAIKQLAELTSDNYLAAIGTNGHFVLMHSVGNRPKRKELDMPLTYADYYYVEALVRLKSMIRKNQIYNNPFN